MEIVLDALRAVVLLIAVGAVVFLAPFALMLIFSLVSGFSGDRSARTDDPDGE